MSVSQLSLAKESNSLTFGHKGLNAPFTFSLETPSLSSGTLDKYLKSVLGDGSSTSTMPDLLKSSSDTSTTATSISETTKENSSTPAAAVSPQAVSPINESNGVPSPPNLNLNTANSQNVTLSMSSNTESQMVSGNSAQQPPSSGQQAAETGTAPNFTNGLQLATTDGSSTDIINAPAGRGQTYVDITEYLNMPQAEAAKKLGIPPSTLSKRWKEAVRKRKWPYRMVCKIDKEIMTLLHNVPQGPNAPPLPEEIETALGLSLKKRQEELRPVVIRI